MARYLISFDDGTMIVPTRSLAAVEALQWATKLAVGSERPPGCRLEHRWREPASVQGRPMLGIVPSGQTGPMELRAMTVVRHTADLEAMIDFYRDALGMAVTKQWDRSAADRGAILAPAGHVANATVEVLTLGDVAVPGVAPVNIVLTVFVDDARSALRRVRAAGIAIARELEDTSWGHRSFGVDDPDGLRIWIVEELDSPAHP